MLLGVVAANLDTCNYLLDSLYICSFFMIDESQVLIDTN